MNVKADLSIKPQFFNRRTQLNFSSCKLDQLESVLSCSLNPDIYEKGFPPSNQYMSCITLKQGGRQRMVGLLVDDQVIPLQPNADD